MNANNNKIEAVLPTEEVQEPTLQAVETRTPGSILRTAREAAGLSQEDVAEQLCLLRSYVVAIDADNYCKFNSETFIRGYLRSYAKLLDLDAEQLVACFNTYMEQHGDQKGIIKPPPGVVVPVKRSNGVMRSAIALGLIVVLMFGAYLFTRPGESSVAPISAASLDSSGGKTLPEKMGEGLRPSEVPPASAQGSEVQTVDSADTAALAEPEAGSDTSLNAGMADGSIEEPVMVEPEAAPLVSAAETPENSAAAVAVDAGSDVSEAATSVGSSADLESTVVVGGAKLSFSLSEDCWIEVSDATGERVFTGLRRNGDSFDVAGQAPFSVLLGNAPGVELRFNGEPVEMAIRSDNSARIRVGDS